MSVSVTNAPKEIYSEATRFNPMTHQPPKYDIFGRIKKVKFNPEGEKKNILSEKDQIKMIMSEKRDTNINNNINNRNNFSSAAYTRSELLENRRRDRIPDISYDLDHDGFVGGRDYVLAKRFDKDGDGKLNEKEKKEANEAIHNNIEDAFVWNLDNQGVNRGYRILQKRGKIIDGEDFQPLRETYPVHPISLIKPNNNTTTELKDRRKMMTRSHIEEKIRKWDKANPSVVFREPPRDFSNNKLEVTSIKQKKEIEHKQARLNCGLKAVEEDIKNRDRDPGLEYVYEPKHKTARDLKDEIRKENIEQSKKLSKKDHKDEIARLNEREDEIFEKLFSDNQERLTIDKLKKMRKKEILEYNLKTFSKQTIGVHGHELPKYADQDEMKEWWKLKEGYVENPKFNSLSNYKESVKYWKKPEEILLNEHKDVIPLPDSVKKVRELKSQDDLIIKVNNLNHFKSKGFDPDNPKPIDIDAVQKKHIYKWTTLVNQFAPQKFKKGRFFDSLPNVREDDDEKAIFSSFTGDGKFESDYIKNLLNAYVKKKEEKNSKTYDNHKTSIEYLANQSKENLFQKFSVRDQNINLSNKFADRPKTFTIRTKGL